MRNQGAARIVDGEDEPDAKSGSRRRVRFRG